MNRAVTELERGRVGLCADCRHSRRIISDRGAQFFRCELSFRDANFPKYPTLPVIRCSGYEPDRDESPDLPRGLS